ncbi:hypothetical protein RPHASCH2410_PD04155 (plasmid) [Rhizobium phaseoli Ch24-10]|nr:hypothetical protein RPHASCH2410_PD04155 [Rhizobium phaseoli Ch24-10]
MHRARGRFYRTFLEADLQVPQPIELNLRELVFLLRWPQSSQQVHLDDNAIALSRSSPLKMSQGAT